VPVVALSEQAGLSEQRTAAGASTDSIDDLDLVGSWDAAVVFEADAAATVGQFLRESSPTATRAAGVGGTGAP